MNTKTRKPPKVATGCCRWLDGNTLRINGTEYGYSPVVRNGTTTGHLLFKDGGDEVYAIDARGPEMVCDCPDATYRRSRCKHRAALTVALPRRPVTN
jgi:hypothetical protein